MTSTYRLQLLQMKCNWTCVFVMLLLVVDISVVICVAREHNKYTRVKHLVIMKWSLLALSLVRSLALWNVGTDSVHSFTRRKKKHTRTCSFFINAKCNCAFAFALSHLTVHSQAMNDNENSNKSLTLSPVCATALSNEFRYSSAGAHTNVMRYRLLWFFPLQLRAHASSMYVYVCRFTLFMPILVLFLFCFFFFVHSLCLEQENQNKKV